jgi:hypothetical protein
MRSAAPHFPWASASDLSTSSARFLRHARSFSRSSGRFAARIRVGRSPLADRQCPDGDALGHLHDRQKRVDTAQGRGCDWHAQHGKHRLRGDDARQRRRASGTSDEYLEPPLFRRLGPFEHALRRSVRGQDAQLVRNAEFAQHLDRALQHVEIGLASHDDADQRLLRHARRVTEANGAVKALDLIVRAPTDPAPCRCASAASPSVAFRCASASAGRTAGLRASCCTAGSITAARSTCSLHS